jgi:hypothetical protein
VNILRARGQIANNFQGNSFACGNLSLLVPYVTLIHAGCGASYRLAPRQLSDWPACESGPALTACILTYRMTQEDKSIFWNVRVPVNVRFFLLLA